LLSYDETHSKIEWQRYPYAGDPNPKVKMGIAHINTNKVVWVDEDKR
jgi:dipeptidyl-peptidase-4